MKLRTQVLVFLLIFALTPLLTAVVINVPLVFDNLELFYRKAHLQSLRAIFYDLDQHLANRQELVRLLSKSLPKPNLILGETGNPKDIDLARTQYTKWINLILPDHLDIVQIIFMDNTGQERFWLERDNSTEWRPTLKPPERSPEDFIRAAERLEPGQVLRSFIRLTPQNTNKDPNRFMTLYLIGRIVITIKNRSMASIGLVSMVLDVGGIAKFYPQAIWVNSNGSYLQTDTTKSTAEQAFHDYPGLDKIFAKGKLDLWKGPKGQQILWEALFPTESSGPLWVGRHVDSAPITAFRNALAIRVLIIVAILVILVLMMARWIAVRLELWGKELTSGIERMLNGEEAVAFIWNNGPKEIQSLARDLTDLARAQAGYAKELEASNRYKSEFLANMSHELRTPLNSILLLSKLMADADAGLSQDQIKQARVINQAGCDLQALIENLLDHSKIEAREIAVNFEWIEPKSIIEEVIELVQPQFESKNLTLQLNIVPNTPARIRTDAEKLRQILKNFLANALKFTEHGGIEISISSAGQDACPVRIAVHDTGIGIEGDKHELIFEPFKQADGSTSRRYGGTGLGLSISRKLARLIGGLIELESRPGVGSTFSLLLPIDPETPPTYVPPVPTAPCLVPEVANGVTCKVQFSGQWVMLVEHNVEILLELTPILENWGLKVMVAANQEEALECLYDGDACSVVLLGPGISEQEGCVTIQKIHAESCRTALPVIVVSLESDNEQKERYYTAGAAEWLCGPLDLAHLEAALQRQLAGTIDNRKDA